MQPLRGQVALVTGAGAGIGHAIAARLAQEGAATVVADINDTASLAAVEQIQAAGGTAAWFHADVAVEAHVQAMIACTEERFGGLDILVNNVGVAPWPSFPDADPAQWGRALDTNLRGTMLGIHFALEPMRRRSGGAIVNISSMAGVGYRPYDAPEYAATKAAIVRLTASLGSLAAKLNVRVNCICPGWVETADVQRSLASMSREECASLSYPPPDVLIQPEQIGELVVMFVRDEALAGRVLVWPDGEPWRLIPLDATV